MTITHTIPTLTIHDDADLGKRLHDAIARFRRMKDSPVWRIETFSFGELVSDLTPDQQQRLATLVSGLMGTVMPETVRVMNVIMPDDLVAGDGEIYTLVVAFDSIELDQVSTARPALDPVIFRRLMFAKMPISSTVDAA